MLFPIVNFQHAHFECTFGRGCEGECCRQGRPPVYPEECERIDLLLPKLLRELRPAAKAIVALQGYVSRRRKSGQPVLRVVDGWCVFFNNGCTLHRAGAAEGDRFRYKPWVCATFPIARERSGDWYVRQKGLNGEIWDLFCLDPCVTNVTAAESLRQEAELLMIHLKSQQPESVVELDQ